MPNEPDLTPTCCQCGKRILESDQRLTLTFCSLDDYERWVENLIEKG